MKDLEQNSEKRLFLTGVQRLKFLEFVLKFGLPAGKIEYFYSLYSRFCEPMKNMIILPDISYFRAYVKLFYAVLLFHPQLKEKVHFFFFKFDGGLILKRVTALCLLKNKINSYARRQEKFKIKSRRYTDMLKKGNSAVSTDSKIEKWKNTDDFSLLKGIMIHGFDEWERIINDTKLWEEEGKPSKNENPMWKNLFEKIEQKSAPQEEEKNEVENYLKEYLKIRSTRLLDVLLEEEEKRND